VELCKSARQAERNLSSAHTGIAAPQPIHRNPDEAPTTDLARIRKDLWLAIIDYASGRRYVWDEAKGIAREATQDDKQHTIPTLTPDELDRWRSEFLEANVPSLNTPDLTLARRWRDDRLPTFSLPLSLQQRWNRELTRRVRQRLNSFFGSKLKTAANERLKDLPLARTLDLKTR
jgi:hypothetical protein